VKHLLIIILPIFLLTSPLFGQETGVLYQFKNSSGFVWKTFGKAKVQPKYEGEVSNGTPEGFGVLSYPFTHGKTVVGEWEVGKEWYTEHYNKDGTLIGKNVNGKWILKWGVLFQRKVNGELEWFEDYGENEYGKYVGEIENWIPNGQGKQTYPDGIMYKGEWKDGKKHGQGTYTQPDGSKYVGEWNKGKRNGYGTFTSADGSKYVGKFRKGKRNGHGTFTSAGGSKYVGEWNNGKRNGHGTFTSPDGSKYVGKFRKGKRNGQGIFTWSDGGKYEGEWKNGVFHGLGTVTLPDGEKYVGDWKNNKKHGQGTYTFLDSSKYAGEFRGNKPWNITFYDKDGIIRWKMVNGKQVDDVYIKISLRNLLSTNNGVMKSCWGLNLLKSGRTSRIKLDKNKKVIGGYVFEILKKYENVTGIKIKFKMAKTFQNCLEKMRNGTSDVMTGLLEKDDRKTYMDYYYWSKENDDRSKQIVISKKSPFAKYSKELEESMNIMKN